MSYRNPGSLKYVNFRKPQTSGVEAKYADVNRDLAKQAALNEKANWNIQVKNNLAQADAAATIGTAISKNASFVDQQSLNNSTSKALDLYYQSKTRLEQSTGTYQKVDDEGNIVYSYEKDNQIIRDYGKFIKDFPQQLASLQYVQQNFSNVGSGEGQILPSNLDPYFNLMMKIDDPNYEGVNVRYDVEQDPNGAPQMGITLFGPDVQKLNRQQGKGDKDSYTIEPGMLAAQLNNANGNPNDFTAYEKNGVYVSTVKKALETNGVVKNGEIDSSFRINGGRKSKVLNNGFTQFYDESFLNNAKLEQFVDPKVKAQVGTAANYGNRSLSTLVRQYADRDEEGNYYIDPLEWNAELSKYTKNPDNRIDFGDGISTLGYDPANESFEKTNGFPKNVIQNAQTLVRTRVLENINANSDPIQTAIGAPKAPDKPDDPKPPTEKDQQRNIIDKVVGDLEKFEIQLDNKTVGERALSNLGLETFEKGKRKEIKDETRKIVNEEYKNQIQSIVNELNNVGGKGKFKYNLETGIVTKSAPGQFDEKTKEFEAGKTLVEIATPVNFWDTKELDKFKQELYNLVDLGVVGEETTGQGAARFNSTD
tara:strand:- start:3388 stop:5166 length:1779 start_codon:yes stop_codon:yes gene_type:complete